MCFVRILARSAYFAMVILQNQYQGLQHTGALRGLAIFNSLYGRKNIGFNNIMKGIILFTSKLKYGVFLSLKMLVYNIYIYKSLSFKVVTYSIYEVLVHTLSLCNVEINDICAFQYKYNYNIIFLVYILSEKS